jgi:hypothetical protein
MIAAWMLYTIAVTLLLVVGASAADYVARALRAPTRVLWAVAMIAAVVLSTRALAGFGVRHETTNAVVIHDGVGTLSSDANEPVGDATRAEGRRDRFARIVTTARAFGAGIYRIEQSATRIDVRPLDRWNGLLVGLWAAASVIALLWLVGALVRIRRIERQLGTRTVSDQPVLVSRDMGPALLGVLRTRTVLPEWVLALPARERDAILAHEREHAAAGDPALFVAAAFLVAVQPWNIALWALLAHLHIAIEVDCDRRVLDAMPDRDERWYGRLLITVYERTTPGLSLTIGLVTRLSNLDLRIRRIARRPRVMSMTGVAASLAAVLLVLTACRAASPVRRAITVPSAESGVSQLPSQRAVRPAPLPALPNATAAASQPTPTLSSTEQSPPSGQPALEETRCSLATGKGVLWPGQWPVNAGCSIYGDIAVVYIDSTNLLVAARDTADEGVTAFFVFETRPGSITPDLVWSTTTGRALLSDSVMSFASPNGQIRPLVLRAWPAPSRAPRPGALELRIDNMMMAQMHGIPWEAIALLPTAPRCTAAERESETMPTVIPGRLAPGAADDLRRACFVTNGQRFQFPILTPEASAR